jgi:hypothetical protein
LQTATSVGAQKRLPSSEPQDFVDALWHARLSALPVGDYLTNSPLSREAAESVAASLYSRLAASGGKKIGWKVAATSPAAQAAFGIEGPFAAPVYDTNHVRAGATISLSSFIAPLFEAEIALVRGGEHHFAAACIEIADSRWGTWRLTGAQALADFGLLGALVLGEPYARPEDELEVVVRHDDVHVFNVAARPEWPRAEELLRMDRNSGDLDAYFVATGAVSTPVPLREGRWCADFGVLGELTLNVSP